MTKKKGQLTTDPEWRKHLRKIGKRFFLEKWASCWKEND